MIEVASNAERADDRAPVHDVAERYAWPGNPVQLAEGLPPRRIRDIGPGHEHHSDAGVSW